MKYALILLGATVAQLALMLAIWLWFVGVVHAW
jgi:hypothetical protein